MLKALEICIDWACSEAWGGAVCLSNAKLLGIFIFASSTVGISRNFYFYCQIEKQKKYK
jgi:hypothetical protein